MWISLILFDLAPLYHAVPFCFRIMLAVSVNVFYRFCCYLRVERQTSATTNWKFPSVQRPLKALLAGDGFTMPDSSAHRIDRLVNSVPRKRAEIAHCCVSEKVCWLKWFMFPRARQRRTTYRRTGYDYSHLPGAGQHDFTEGIEDPRGCKAPQISDSVTGGQLNNS
jgi:hypothetical protein